MVPLWAFALAALLLTFGYVSGRHFLSLVFLHNVDRHFGKHFFALVFGVVVTQFGLAYAFTKTVKDMEEHDPPPHGVLFGLSYLLFWLQVFLTGGIGAFMTLRLMVEDVLPRWLTSGRRRQLIVVLPVSLLLYVGLGYWLNRVLPSSGPHASLLAQWTPKVASVGAMAMGMVTGFAAFTTPYNCLLPFLVKGRSEQTAAYVGALQRRQRHLLALWGKKQAMLFELQYRQPNTTASSSEGERGSGGGLLSQWFRGGSSATAHTIESLQSECDGIQRVSSLIYFQTHEAEELLQYAQSSNVQSWRGLLSAGTGIVLSLFALAKVCMTVYLHLPVWLVGGSGNRDNIASSSFDWNQSMVPEASTTTTHSGDNSSLSIVAAWSTVSTWLSVALVVVAVRGFLLVVFRLTSTFASALRPVTMLHAFATLMGSYFIAQLVLWSSDVGVRSCVGTFGEENYRALPIQALQSINSLSFSISFVLTGIVRRFVLQESFSLE